ncbi:MAG: thermonuclease family protein [Clostridia bacterium]|nr:thermonuclease family protein [Clostridia bacterium]
MKRTFKILSMIIALCLVSAFMFACVVVPDDSKNSGSNSGSGSGGSNGGQQVEFVDYVSNLTLDMTSNTKKEVVTVKSFIDGDTTHFYISKSVASNGVLKARYLAINTPESTGKIQDYGHTASRFTKAKLSGAESIIVETDGSDWELDSTGDRHLVWVWYRNSATEPYRNLNVEILQEGLAIASNTAQNRYGQVASKALAQATAMKLYCHSGKADPEVYRGDAIEVSIKDLRLNIEEYNNKKVAFEGAVVNNYNNTVYVEAYDEDTDMYYGMQVYYGYSLSPGGLEIISLGNYVRIVGTVQYYETGNTYQVSDLYYSEFRPNDPNNLKLIESGWGASYVETTVSELTTGKVYEGQELLGNFADLAVYTTVSLNNLVVKSIYTTDNDVESSNFGAMTLTCEDAQGNKVDIRTVPFMLDGQLVTESYYMGKTISVKGMIDYYYSSYDQDGFYYQVKAFRMDDIQINQ